jgi:hypothetical protein
MLTLRDKAYRFPLAEKVADFYVLELLAAEGDGLAQWKLDKYVEQVGKLLVQYVRTTVGGELRHAAAAAPSQWKKIAGPGLVKLVTEMYNAGREYAWVLWSKHMRRRRGLEIWGRAEKIFSLEWKNHRVGGKGWANAARLLRLFYEDEISLRVFIDQCFTLQHNYGAILDKMFRVEKLKSVLEAQAKGDIPKLVSFASPEVRSLWENAEDAKRKEAREGFDPGWLGVQP